MQLKIKTESTSLFVVIGNPIDDHESLTDFTNNWWYLNFSLKQICNDISFECIEALSLIYMRQSIDDEWILAIEMCRGGFGTNVNSILQVNYIKSIVFGKHIWRSNFYFGIKHIDVYQAPWSLGSKSETGFQFRFPW